MYSIPVSALFNRLHAISPVLANILPYTTRANFKASLFSDGIDLIKSCRFSSALSGSTAYFLQSSDVSPHFGSLGALHQYVGFLKVSFCNSQRLLG